MIAVVKARYVENCYNDAHYVDDYATIVVNPHMPIHKKYLQFEDAPARDIVLIACNGSHELLVDHYKNLLLIKSCREYRVVVEYCNELAAPELHLDDDRYVIVRDDSIVENALLNARAAARWIHENRATFLLARVSVHVDSDNRLLTIIVNEESDVEFNENAYY